MFHSKSEDWAQGPSSYIHIIASAWQKKSVNRCKRHNTRASIVKQPFLSVDMEYGKGKVSWDPTPIP